MTEREDDSLQRAWRDLRVPGPDEGYERPDAETRRALDWLKRAWQAAGQPAPVELPWSVRLRARRAASERVRRAAHTTGRPALGRWAAAVLAFLAGAIWLHFELRPTRAPALPFGSALVAAPSASPGSEAVLVIATAFPAHTELRSGPVRLLLLPNPITPIDTNPTNEEPR